MNDLTLQNLFVVRSENNVKWNVLYGFSINKIDQKYFFRIAEFSLQSNKQKHYVV